MTRRILAAAFALPLAACGGVSPTAPQPPTSTSDITLVVFYDQNGNGLLDPSERVRLGGARVTLAGQAGASAAHTGEVTLHAVPAGTYTAAIDPSSLPPFYAQTGMPRVTVPSSQPAAVAVTLPIGSNQPNIYMAFGDSITNGDGSTDNMGYRGVLQSDLDGLLGAGTVLDEGVEGTRTNEGAQRLPPTLAADMPAYTLIHYGTNDWNKCADQVPCFTIDSLRSMVHSCQAVKSLPVLATIIPANPAFPDQVPPQRNIWVHQIDALIRPMAQQEGALLVDLEAAFLAHGNLPSLFSDHVHPNDQGYAIMAQQFFKAITQPAGSTQGRSLAPSTGIFFHPARNSRPLARP